MALLSNLEGTDQFDTIETKIDAAIDAVNLITASNTLATKVVEIGDWNMDSTAGVSIAHGIGLFNIREVSLMILNDAGTVLFPHAGRGAGGVTTSVYISSIDVTNVNLVRETGGDFDSTDFDATAYNRGWITITYVK
jgi:hypothetical protein